MSIVTPGDHEGVIGKRVRNSMSEPGPNPWLDPGQVDAPQTAVTRPPVVSTGPTQPHPGLHTQLTGHPAPAPTATPAHTPAPANQQPRLWIVGVHGGAGESTIAALR